MMLDIGGWAPPAAPQLRTATEHDLDGIAAMHGRCSADSLYRRYLSGAGAPPRARLALLLANGHTSVAVATGGIDDGRIVAAAQLVAAASGPAELAILVEDAWQRRGLGTALARRLVGHAVGAGLPAVLVYVLATNQPALRTFRRLLTDGALTAATLVDRDGPLLTFSLTAPR
ncbi:GNAT family N-acetyltransferase [Catellatospora sp. KI3]|uniref:GNAT family N-acetyltransferase n=1 Tax=Catellatospora sp. KI3 TaxID=3041620 RepID=UPI0024830C46|nr:GNAT family N-acetyltransferase [Catellatospora sp. KI3]MDI1462760.1 GNAT family N-acetyltransferase [Catellatospora sp. KI3]